jgi:hypothetical protein
VAWMSVSCECCVLSGRGFCDGLVSRPEESYRVWCVWVWSWSLEKWGGLGPQGAVEPLGKNTITPEVWFKTHKCVYKSNRFLRCVPVYSYSASYRPLMMETDGSHETPVIIQQTGVTFQTTVIFIVFVYYLLFQRINRYFD